MMYSYEHLFSHPYNPTLVPSQVPVPITVGNLPEGTRDGQTTLYERRSGHFYLRTGNVAPTDTHKKRISQKTAQSRGLLHGIKMTRNPSKHNINS